MKKSDIFDLNWNFYKLKCQTMDPWFYRILPPSVLVIERQSYWPQVCSNLKKSSTVVFTNSPCLHLVITWGMTAIRSLCSGLTVCNMFSEIATRSPTLPPPAALCSHNRTYGSTRVKCIKTLVLCVISDTRLHNYTKKLFYFFCIVTVETTI